MMQGQKDQMNASMIRLLALAVETHGVTGPRRTANALEQRGLVTVRPIPFAGGFEVVPTPEGRQFITDLGGPTAARREAQARRDREDAR